jgi:hypothetical protein
MVWRDGLSYHFKIIRLFLDAAVDEKTAAQKQKKSQNFGYPLSVFLITTKLKKLGDCGVH